MEKQGLQVITVDVKNSLFAKIAILEFTIAKCLTQIAINIHFISRKEEELNAICAKPYIIINTLCIVKLATLTAV